MDFTSNMDSRLADVLKRTGLAASPSDAKRMANDIHSTERKVQDYFDKKRDEIDGELSLRASNKYVLKVKSKSEEKKEFKLENKPENKPVEVEVEFETSNDHKFTKSENITANKESDIENPVQKSKEEFTRGKEETKSDLGDLFMDEEQKKGQEFLYNFINNHEMKKVDNTQSGIGKYLNGEDPDYNEYLNQARLEILDEEPVEDNSLEQNKINDNAVCETYSEEVVKKVEEKQDEVMCHQKMPVLEENKEEKKEHSEESKVDLTTMFNFGGGLKPQTNQVQKPLEQKPEKQITTEKQDSVSNTSNYIKQDNDLNHPKTGTSMSIDITEMFNFSKRNR